MNSITDALEKLAHHQPYRLVFSRPVKKDSPLTKLTITLLSDGYQGERIENNQAHHHNFPIEELPAYLLSYFGVHFNQLHAFDAHWAYSLGLTKKGKLLSSKTKHQQELPPQGQHNRQKNYLLPEGTLIPPLIEMGVFTREGKIVTSMQDKYRQINHFLSIIQEAAQDLPSEKLTIVDFGCGKSYLTFLLYYYFTEISKRPVEIVGLDLKEEVIAQCNKAAEKYGYTGLSFQVGDVESFSLQRKIHMVLSLHACDTATDYALHQGVTWGADLIFSVPCCQKELNRQLQSPSLPLLTRYGLFKERFSANLTDSIRANLLTACGYRTHMLEFVDWENTPKNTLIRGVKADLSVETKKTALREVEQVLDTFGVEQTFHELLKKGGQFKD